MFTLVAYSQSTNPSVLTALTPIADPHVRVVSPDVIVPRGMANLLAAYGMAVNLTRVQLQSPSLRRFVNHDVIPLTLAVIPGGARKDFFAYDPAIPLAEDEALDALVTDSSGVAERITVLVWFTDGQNAPVKGRIRTVRVTSATTLTANAWTNGALTFVDSLPAGRYQIVGARFQSTNLQAFRFVFVGGIWRPGGVGDQASGDQQDQEFRFGNLGVWGEFNHNTPPTVDFLANGADAAETGFLDLVQVG